MKKILLGCLVLPLALSLGSCIEDTTDTSIMTSDKKDEIAKEDPDKVFSALMQGVYTDFQAANVGEVNHNYFGQMSFNYLTSLMGNDVCMPGALAMSFYHHICDYGWQEFAPAGLRWREYYNHIDKANQVLTAISADSEEKVMKKYLAFAHTLRGYAYLQLSYLYQRAYYVGADGTEWDKAKYYDNSKELLVPIVTETLTGNQPRATVEEVYKLIISDLTRGYELYNEIGSLKTPEPTDLDGCVAAMYLARVHMLKHEWKEAAKYAKVVMDNFGVLQGDDIHQGFSDVKLPDVVFGCVITTDNTTTYPSFFSMMDKFAAGYASRGVDRLAYAPFVNKIDDKDTRKDWFLHKGNAVKLAVGYVPKRYERIYNELKDSNPSDAGKFQMQTLYFGYKFKGAGETNLQAGKFGDWVVGDYIYLRSEEAYLMYAECLAHQDMMGEARAAIESFMKTRNPDYKCSVTSKEAMIKEINFQKRVEFWGEGQEYLDNRRLNISVDRTQDGAENNHFSGARIKLTQDDRNMVYQIPISEINNNPMITPGDQNMK